jgi:hypothetical protein
LLLITLQIPECPHSLFSFGPVNSTFRKTEENLSVCNFSKFLFIIGVLVVSLRTIFQIPKYKR